MQADHEHALAPEVVGDAATEEQQPGEGQGVGRQHPLAVGRRDVQGPLGRGQGDDHHRGVEHHHQLGHRDDGQGPEALGVAVGLRLGFGALVDVEVEVMVSPSLPMVRAPTVLTSVPPRLRKRVWSLALRMAYNRSRSSGST